MFQQPYFEILFLVRDFWFVIRMLGITTLFRIKGLQKTLAILDKWWQGRIQIEYNSIILKLELKKITILIAKFLGYCFSTIYFNTIWFWLGHLMDPRNLSMTKNAYFSFLTLNRPRGGGGIKTRPVQLFPLFSRTKLQ